MQVAFTPRKGCLHLLRGTRGLLSLAEGHLFLIPIKPPSRLARAWRPYLPSQLGLRPTQML